MHIIIIGAGPGGYETALKAAEKGQTVTLVSAGPLGGTCLNEGCIPTKALRRSADVADLVADASIFGVNTGSGTIDIERIMARKEEVVAQLRDGISFLMKKAKVNLLSGRASFVDSRTVRVALDAGGETEVTGDAILVATGSVPASLPIPGAELCVDSSALLSVREIPRRLCVIGAGVRVYDDASFGCRGLRRGFARAARARAVVRT